MNDKTEQAKRRIKCTLDRLESFTSSESEGVTSSESERAISSEGERFASSRPKGKSVEQLENESRIIRNL